MRWSTRIALAAAAVVLAACGDATRPVQPGLRPAQDLVPLSSNPNIVPGQYIVVFKDGVTDPDGLAQTLVGLYGGTLKHTYKSAIKGFAAVLSDAAVAALNAQSTLVDYIEPDQKGGPDGEGQQTPQSSSSTPPSGGGGGARRSRWTRTATPGGSIGSISACCRSPARTPTLRRVPACTCT